MRRVLAAALSLAACQPAETRRVSMDGDWPLAFVVELREGVPIAAGPAFSMSDGEIGFGSRLHVLEDAGNDVAFALFSVEDLSNTLETLDDSRLDTAALLPRASAPPESIYRFIDPHVSSVSHGEMRLIDELGEVVGSQPAAEALSDFVLQLPSHSDFCQAGLPDRMEPYGSQRFLLDSLLSEDRPIVGFDRLDGDRLLIVSRRLVTIVDRGGAADLDGALSFDDGPADIFLSGVVRADANRWMVYGRGEIGADSLAFIADVEMDADRVVTIATATATSDFGIVDAVLDPRGFFVLTGLYGELWVRSSQDMVLEPRSDPTATGDTLRTITLTHDPAEPHLIGTDAGRVYVGDALDDRWDRGRVIAPGTSVTMDVHGTAASNDGTVRWAVGRGGVAARWTRELGWQDAGDIPVPVDLQCSDEHDTIETLGGIRAPFEGVTMLPSNDPLIIVSQCSALIALKFEEQCIAAVRLEPGPTHVVADSLLRVRTFDEEVIAVGRRGQIYAAGL